MRQPPATDRIAAALEARGLLTWCRRVGWPGAAAAGEVWLAMAEAGCPDRGQAAEALRAWLEADGSRPPAK